eukprot:m.962687 g.962687  ORF g.962687 m.962687 type:complete len:662 (+) comp23892_c0_seq16:306-2291(+)
MADVCGNLASDCQNSYGTDDEKIPCHANDTTTPMTEEDAGDTLTLPQHTIANPTDTEADFNNAASNTFIENETCDKSDASQRHLPCPSPDQPCLSTPEKPGTISAPVTLSNVKPVSSNPQRGRTNSPSQAHLVSNISPKNMPSAISSMRDDDVYTLRNINFGMRECTIVCQNENGPCPLLAICNVLLLRGTITLDPTCGYIDTATLVQTLTDVLLGKVDEYSDRKLEFENNVQTCMDIFPRLSKGLDVNPKFSHCEGFEFTPQLQIFDIFRIGIYHGWVVDPHDLDSVETVGSKTYNQLLEMVIDSHTAAVSSTQESVDIDVSGRRRSENKGKSHGSYADSIGTKDTAEKEQSCESTIYTALDNVHQVTRKDIDILSDCSTEPICGDDVARQDYQTDRKQTDDEQVRVMQTGAVAEQWLADNQSQLTIHGLCELHSTLADGEICVLFRNNHFFTLMKRQQGQELLTLVTDQGFAGTDIVWETLNSISNDSQFLTDTYSSVSGHRDDRVHDVANGGLRTEFSPDGNSFHPVAASVPPELIHSSTVPFVDNNTTDAQLARQLQYEERMHGMPNEWSDHDKVKSCLEHTALVPPTDTDAALARRMQAEEDAHYALQTRRIDNVPPSGTTQCQPLSPQTPSHLRTTNLASAREKPAQKERNCCVM